MQPLYYIHSRCGSLSYLQLVLYLLALLFPATLVHGQESKKTSVLEIKGIEATEERELKIKLNGINEANAPFLKEDATLFTVMENDSLLEVVSGKTVFDDKKGLPVLLFLLDISGSMDQSDYERMLAKKERYTSPESSLAKAKKAIIDVLNGEKWKGQNAYLVTFHDVMSKRMTINSTNAAEELEKIVVGRDTDLNYAVNQQIKELENSFPEEKRVMVLLTDGRNDTARNPRYKGSSPAPLVSQQEVKNTVIAQAAEDFAIYPIGIGNRAEEDFLRSLSESSKDDSDYYLFNVAPTDIGEAISRVASELGHNFELIVYPNADNAVYRGEQRKLSVSYKDASANQDLSTSRDFSLGNSHRSIDLSEGSDPPLIVMFLLAFFIIALLLGILWQVVPIYMYQQFKKKHVKKYSEYTVEFEQKSLARQTNAGGKVLAKVTPNKKDASTLIPFNANDTVVTKCEHVVTLDTWRENGYKCREYPKNCENGSPSRTSDKDFFVQKTKVDQKVNWLWFGALGGGIGWAIFTILYKFLPDNASDIFASFDEEGILVSENLYVGTLAGLALGMGISFALAKVEENGQSKKLSWGRITKRVLIGGLLSVVIFNLVNLFSIYVLNDKDGYISTGLNWTVFGLGLASVVSIGSSIDLNKALKGGAMASPIACILYIGISFLGWSPMVDQLLGFIVYGAVLGVLLITTVSSMEDFELEYIAPEKYRQFNPVSKWLKSGYPVTIGTKHGAEVYIKWNDPAAQAEHAILSYEPKQNQVYIEAKAETLLNNQVLPVGQRTPFNDGDIIQLGAQSVSKMRLNAKEEGTVSAASPTGQRVANYTASPNIQVEQGTSHTGRKKIKITKKK